MPWLIDQSHTLDAFSRSSASAASELYFASIEY